MGSNDSRIEYRIASLVHSHFNALPQRCKPTIRPNGTPEWIPLSGIVLVTREDTAEESLTCVALATGAKCLSSSQIHLCQGLVLHDSHAEILALRAFNRWLLEECKSMLTHSQELSSRDKEGIGCQLRNDGNGQISPFLEWRVSRLESTSAIPGNHAKELLWPPFKLKENIRIWMYCTCAPCGDASMELCMAAQDDPTPWDVRALDDAATEIESDLTKGLLDGRAHFSVLGAVRRKPSRADAEPTLSKSCSDKLAAKQITSLLSFPASLLIAPSPNAYLANLILPEDEISQVACERSFGNGQTGRLRELNGRKWQDFGASARLDSYYAFFPFTVRSLPMEQLSALWHFSKSKDAGLPASKSSNKSAVWTAASSFGAKPAYTSFRQKQSTGRASKSIPKTFPTNIIETILNGVKQGYRITSPDARKASALSRAKMCELLCDIVKLLPEVSIGYYQSKDGCPVNENEASRKRLDDRSEMGERFAHLKECVVSSPTYFLMKRNAEGARLLHLRKQALEDVRQTLGNWIENRGDEQWTLGPAKDKNV
ncbi:hypothetical protein D8B26_003364 [Coccidioides posadasii str. Silveira]|uniref:Uncharacterized protein n=1 Tax=Coccidioides posadasii (strain RMSCC 757 / Silveira) TaxID=443226 RepID=E9CZV0_COCPS|nr:conserved hypothetical protein [Coccidioides posadasii str. Silveira]QVM08684.1 hypothetical protein D8B26_003364 [Coccidioides posadasii str. Silveira]